MLQICLHNENETLIQRLGNSDFIILKLSCVFKARYLETENKKPTVFSSDHWYLKYRL